MLAEATETPRGGTKLFADADVRRIMDARAQMKKKLIADTTMVANEFGAFGAPWLMVTNAAGETEPFFGSDR